MFNTNIARDTLRAHTCATSIDFSTFLLFELYIFHIEINWLYESKQN